VSLWTARTNITPPLGVAVDGGFSLVFSDHILDALYANALVFEDGRTEIARVSVDGCQMPTVAARVKRACDIPQVQLFVTSTRGAATVGGVLFGSEAVNGGGESTSACG
jgi:hypothetical protein